MMKTDYLPSERLYFAWDMESKRSEFGEFFSFQYFLMEYLVDGAGLGEANELLLSQHWR